MNKIKAMRWLLAALCLLFLLSSCASPSSDTLEVHMLDVGNADCFLVKQGDAAMLIDGGEPEDADHIVSYLHTHGVERLEAVILSHPHTDHIGSLQRVIEAYETDTVYYAAIPDGIEAITPMHTRLYEAIAGAKSVLYEASGGVAFSLGKAQVQIYPVEMSSEDANEYSLFVRVTFGEERVLFTGDATEKAQRALMNSGLDITATILKVSHHGGKVDTTRSFLDAVRPQVALISCGAENAYGHPHDDTLTALEERGITCYRSDLCGDMSIAVTGYGDRFIQVAR